MGQKLRDQLLKVQQQFPNIIKEVRGKGLFNAIELNNKAVFPLSAYDICLKLKERGILAKPTHDTIIRLTPPLCMRLNRPTFSFPASCLFTPTLNPILVKTKDEKKAKKAEVTVQGEHSQGRRT